MHRKYIAIGFTVLMLVGSAGGVLALAPGQGDASPASDQQSASCDYEQLFDRTVDSVVSVQTGGGQGSGFVVSVGTRMDANLTVANETDGADGLADATHLLTNAHVVRGAENVTIQFNRGEYRTGTVIGQSAYADLAVVRVTDAPDYVTPLNVAGEDPPRGRPVAALGNPFGLQQTITHGIISGKNRSMPTQRGFTIPNVLQTDAPISPGNSGGPLVSCDGTVVGVNTAGIGQQQAENIGFAVSASVVRKVVPELVATGEFDYPFLGVSTQPVTPTVAEANDLNETRGITVVSVPEGSPASGVLQGADNVTLIGGSPVAVGGDVILAIDGQEIRTGEDLATYLIQQTEPGDTVALTILRDGDRQTVDVTIGERPEPRTR